MDGGALHSGGLRSLLHHPRTGIGRSIEPATFFFLQLVFASLIGFVIYDETATLTMLIGAVIIVASGLFTLWRERKRALMAAQQS